MNYEGKRVMLYCRVSTDQQAKNGDSIQDQTEALTKWAEDNRCVVVGTYIDAGFSGAKSYTTRPQFVQMLKDSERIRPDMVLFTRLDRFTRNPRDYYNVAHTFEEHGLQWKAIWQDFDSTTAAGQAMIGTMVVFSKLERDNTSARIIAHNIEKRARGELVSGKLPRGYMIKDKKPVKDPEKEEAVNTFFRSYLSGAGMSESLRNANLHGLGIASVSGASAMLRNAKAYAGMIQGIPCEPYLTEEECQIILRGRKARPKKTDQIYLFRGLVVCGECRRNLGAHRQAWKSKHGKGYNLYYNCTRHYALRKCDNTVNMLEGTIEGYLIDNLDQIMQEHVALIERQRREANTEDIEKKIRQLQQKRKRTFEAYVDGIVEKEDFREVSDRIQSEIEELQGILEKVPQRGAQSVRAILCDGWMDMYMDLDRVRKREFWYHVIDRVVVRPDRSMEVRLRV